jgi:DNA-binding transcriptional regulator PaaX
MAIRGIGVNGVASEIGALGRRKRLVEESELIKGLCERFGASGFEARRAIQRAIKEGSVVREEKDGKTFIKVVISR